MKKKEKQLGVIIIAIVALLVFPILLNWILQQNAIVPVVGDGTTWLANMIAPHFSKRPYFSAEKELRAMFWDTDGRLNNTPEGLLFKVDLNELIESIFVAPFSKPWYKDIIQELIGKYGLEKEVLHSGI